MYDITPACFKCTLGTNMLTGDSIVMMVNSKVAIVIKGFNFF